MGGGLQKLMGRGVGLIGEPRPGCAARAGGEQDDDRGGGEEAVPSAVGDGAELLEGPLGC